MSINRRTPVVRISHGESLVRLGEKIQESVIYACFVTPFLFLVAHGRGSSLCLTLTNLSFIYSFYFQASGDSSSSKFDREALIQTEGGQVFA